MFSKGGLGNLMKQAQQMQEKMTQVQEEIAKIEVTGEAGAGLVKVTINISFINNGLFFFLFPIPSNKRKYISTIAVVLPVPAEASIKFIPLNGILNIFNFFFIMFF